MTTEKEYLTEVVERNLNINHSSGTIICGLKTANDDINFIYMMDDIQSEFEIEFSSNSYISILNLYNKNELTVDHILNFVNISRPDYYEKILLEQNNVLRNELQRIVDHYVCRSEMYTNDADLAWSMHKMAADILEKNPIPVQPER